MIATPDRSHHERGAARGNQRRPWHSLGPTMKPKKHEILVVRYGDGACSSLHFLSDTRLSFGYRPSDDGPTKGFVLDLTSGEFIETASAPGESCGRVGYADAVGTVAAVIGEGLRGIELRSLTQEVAERKVADDVQQASELRQRSQLRQTIARTGRIPLLRLTDGGDALWFSAGALLKRVDVASGKVVRTYSCFDRVNLVVERGPLLVAHSKEGLLHFFDARSAAPLLYLRFTLTGWIAFRGDGAWDASQEQTRGVELSWSESSSSAFVPGVGFGVLEGNRLPLVQVQPAIGGRSPGLLSRSLGGVLASALDGDRRC